jgi:hypothetical protein
MPHADTCNSDHIAWERGTGRDMHAKFGFDESLV